MFTVCPKCALTLVVTAADLKVAQGYVRCGRCSNVFNAIAALSDDRQAAGLEGYVQPEPLAAEAAPTQEENLEFDPVATNVADVFVEPELGDEEETGTFEAIVLETGEPDPTEPEEEAGEETAAPDPDRELDQELQSLARRIEAESQEVPALPAPALPAEENIFSTDSGLPGARESASRRWLWRGGIVVLFLTLVVQMINHYRHDLAVNPPLNGPLTAIYHALGVSLVPRWNLLAYEVHQLGAATSPIDADQLVVRASLKNAAPRAQPLPLLRVAVQDRFGNRIAARDVAPQSYVPHSIPPHALLAAGQRIDVEMNFLDPGGEAVGFEIDACLPAPGGGVICANPPVVP
jgi:predicted Zn finger-like uncharacterized protein